MTAFDVADRCFSNASNFTVRRDVLSASGAVREISRSVGRMFAAISDQEDEPAVRSLRRRLATLRMTVNGALLPLSTPVLQLRAQIAAIVVASDAFGSDLVALSSRLTSACDIDQDEVPPKASVLRDLLADARGRVGIVSSPLKMRMPQIAQR